MNSSLYHSDPTAFSSQISPHTMLLGVQGSKFCRVGHRNCTAQFHHSLGSIQQGRYGRNWRAYAFDQQQQSVPAPWSLTFDLRERETDWTEENKVSMGHQYLQQTKSMWISSAACWHCQLDSIE